MSDSAQNALLLFVLGPVQEFIATARRCGDLWFGSWLLGELARSAAVEASGAPEAQLIFPDPREGALVQRSHGSVANKLQLRVTDATRGRQLAARMEEVARDRLRVLATEAFGKVGQGDLDREAMFCRRTAMLQLEDLLEMYWVVVPIQDSDYASARQRAERLLAARKNVRTWVQPEWAAAGVPKSSMDGARESVLSEQLFLRERRDDPVQVAALHRQYKVRPAERLCGVGVLKRFGAGAQQDRVFSTSHVAALPWMMGADVTSEHFAAYKNTVLTEFGLKSGGGSIFELAPRATGVFGRMDGQLLFESRLDDVRQEAGAEESSLKVVREALRSLVKAAARTPREPIPYYVLLLADGDRMGVFLDGIRTVEGHQSVSRQLSLFARRAEEIVNGEHFGSLVYSGGDDVMALLPMHSALACASALRVCFAELIAACDAAAPDGQRPTLSVGLAIQHHLEPLSVARKRAKDAEKRAKVTRNALAVIYDPRGGSPLEVAGEWERPAGEMPLHRRLERLIELRRRGAISAKAGHELAALSVRTEGYAAGIVEAEAMRILLRKESGAGAVEDSVRQELIEMAEDPARLGRELVLADVLAQAHDQAEGPL